MFKRFMQHIGKSRIQRISKLQKLAIETLAAELQCSYREAIDLALLPHVIHVAEKSIPISEKDYNRYKDFILMVRQYENIIEKD